MGTVQYVDMYYALDAKFQPLPQPSTFQPILCHLLVMLLLVRLPAPPLVASRHPPPTNTTSTALTILTSFPTSREMGGYVVNAVRRTYLISVIAALYAITTNADIVPPIKDSNVRGIGPHCNRLDAIQ
jgi:hypothetical protein